MAALGREAGVESRGKGAAPVGAGEVPQVGGNLGWVGGAVVSAASRCWRTLLKRCRYTGLENLTRTAPQREGPWVTSRLPEKEAERKQGT